MVKDSDKNRSIPFFKFHTAISKTSWTMKSPISCDLMINSFDDDNIIGNITRCVSGLLSIGGKKHLSKPTQSLEEYIGAIPRRG
jgi:hypothetical protein